MNILKGTSKSPRLALILALILSTPSYAISMAKLKGLGGFQATILAVAMVNKAMRSAAENPMDRFRRNNLRTAMLMLPPAIMALSADFKAGKVHNDDFPMVQGILGKYVDVSAADVFDKFLKNPTAANIPELPASFPKEALAKAEASGSGYGYDESRTAVGSTLMEDGGSKKPVSNEIVDLEAALATPKKTADGAGASSFPTTTYHEGASVGGESFAARLSNDISEIEKNLSSDKSAPSSREPASFGGLNSKVLTEEEIKEKEDDFFRTPAKKAKKPAAGKRKVSDAKDADAASEYIIKAKPKFWRFSPLFHFATEIMIRNAGAEGGGGCKDCQGGGGQGGGGGEIAAAALQAAAMAVAAIVPAVVQAEADKDIARTNAAAQISMTTISSNTSKYMADNQKQIAEQQAGIAAQMAQANNASQTERLQMQIAELKDQRLEEKQAKAEERTLQMQYNNERIQLAKEEAAQNLQLAKEQMNLQLTQAGLAQGFTTGSGYVVAGNNNSLAVSRVGAASTTSTPVTGTFSGVNLAGQQRTTPSTSSTGLAFAGNNNVVNPNVARGIASTGSAVAKSRGFVSAPLLIGDDESPDFVFDEGRGLLKRKKPSKGAKRLIQRIAGRLPLISSVGKQAKTIAKAPLNLAGLSQKSGISRGAVGSGRGDRLYVASFNAAETGGDLESFAEGTIRRAFPSVPADAVRHAPKESSGDGHNHGAGGGHSAGATGSARGIYGGVPSGLPSGLGFGQ